ncbi:MAG: hypothetical protein Q9220_007754 [cf. Caloplaca sp. 1 TL-2023]
MVTASIGNQKFTNALLDGGSLVLLISRKKLNELDPRPRIYGDGYIRVSLANDTLETLDKYVKVPINVQGVQATVRAWAVVVDVCDTLLGLAWMQRVHCNPNFGSGTVTIGGDDQQIREVPAALAPMETLLPVVEFDGDDEMTADQACQQLIDEQESPGVEALGSLSKDDSTDAFLAAAVFTHPTFNAGAPTPVDLKPIVITDRQPLLAAFLRQHDETLPEQSSEPTIPTKHSKYRLGIGPGFPTQHRPGLRNLTTAPLSEVTAWHEESGIKIGCMADTPERIEAAQRLLYTWKDCFAKSIRDIKTTDLIEHSIDLAPNARPVMGTRPKYTREEREFADKIFPEMEDA